MIACKYAFDQNDEYCAKCDGISIETADGEVDATKCTSYEPGEDRIECVIDNDLTPSDIPESAASEYTFKPNTAPIIPIMTDPTNNESIKITYTSGVSYNYKDSVYKFECTEERIIHPGMNIEEEREKLWAILNDEIDKQILDLTQS